MRHTYRPFIRPYVIWFDTGKLRMLFERRINNALSGSSVYFMPSSQAFFKGQPSCPKVIDKIRAEWILF